MMTIEQMKRRKEELGYTCEMIAEKSGVPISTVQKIFSGATTKPRYSTREALEMVLKMPLYYEYDVDPEDASYVTEEAPEYDTVPGNAKQDAKKMGFWHEVEANERWPNQGEYTVADYEALPDDMRVELIDGMFFDLGAPTDDHQGILFYLAVEFDKCIQEYDCPCKVRVAPFDVNLDRDNKTMVEPDVLVLCDRGEHEDRRIEEGKYLVGEPDLVAEILSPSTKYKDCMIKLHKYMRAGVREYWIIDLQKETVLIYLFEEDLLPVYYSFEDTIPIGISEGKCSIDFSKISVRIKKDKQMFSR